MALVRCAECAREVSDQADSCPGCGAPVDAERAVAAPEAIGFAGGEFVGTSAMILTLATKAIHQLGYRLDRADAAAGTASFTTGMTMGSFSGVSGTITWQETSPYRFRVSGQGKQNVAGGQAVAFNLFDEANGKVQKVIAEMQRLASGGAEGEAAPDNGPLIVAILVAICLVVLFVAMAG